MSLLGLDVGTTGCKAAAFSLDGACLATAYREYATLQPAPDRAELDSRLIIGLIRETLTEVAAATPRDPITAMSVSTMGEAMTPVAEDGAILGNCILGVDLRGAEIIDRLREDIGQEAFYAINPNILAPNYTLPKLVWLRDNEPDLYRRTWKFLLWGDLVTFALGCEPLTSHSHANRTLLYDIHAEDWSDRLLAWAGIDRAILPTPVPSGTIAGTVRDAIADDCGLPRGVQVVVGGHDQCCNLLGAGVHEAGKAVSGMGTVECITPAYDGIPDAQPMLACGLNVEHSLLPNLYVSFLYNQSGVLVRWFRDTFAAADKRLAGGADIYDALNAEMPADPTRLLVLPHFEITGAPHYIADSAGAIAGLKTSTTRGDILKAIMESATFYFVEPLDALKSLGIDTSEFVATGGGARSDAWLQIKADILGVPFVRPKYTECGVLGAAMLAGAATGVFANVADAARAFVRRDRAFEPDPQRHRIYQDRYAHYQRLYPAMKDLLADMQAAP